MLIFYVINNFCPYILFASRISAIYAGFPPRLLLYSFIDASISFIASPKDRYQISSLWVEGLFLG